MQASLVAQTVKNPPAMWETWVRSLGWEDPPGGGHGNPLQYSCLENPMDRGAWRATVHGAAKSRSQLSTSTHTFEERERTTSAGEPGTSPSSPGAGPWCRGVLSRFSRVQLFVTPWTVARQAPLSIGFSRQEYWRGLLCPPSGDLPNPRIQPPSSVAPAMQENCVRSLGWEDPLEEGMATHSSILA